MKVTKLRYSANPTVVAGGSSPMAAVPPREGGPIRKSASPGDGVQTEAILLQQGFGTFQAQALQDLLGGTAFGLMK